MGNGISLGRLKTHPEGTPFDGEIRDAWDESVPSWPVPDRAQADAPSVLFTMLDDLGYAQLGRAADLR